MLYSTKQCFHGIHKVGGVVGNFPDSLKRSIRRPQARTTVTSLYHPQSQLSPEHPQKLAQESVSKTNTNLRNTSWRKGSLQLSIPWKTHQQVSLKKTGEHSSPVGLRVFGIWLVCVCMWTVLRPERKGEEKDSSETPPLGPRDVISEGHLQPLLPRAHPQGLWTDSTGN